MCQPPVWGMGSVIEFKRIPLRFFDMTGLEIFSEIYVTFNLSKDE
jgi:hypothetical protein